MAYRRTDLLITLLQEIVAKQAFMGGSHNVGRRKDILNKPHNIPTSEGTKEKGFGRPHHGRKLRNVSRLTHGELRTSGKAPVGISRPSFKHRRFLDVFNLARTPLLLDDLRPT